MTSLTHPDTFAVGAFTLTAAAVTVSTPANPAVTIGAFTATSSDVGVPTPANPAVTIGAFTITSPDVFVRTDTPDLAGTELNVIAIMMDDVGMMQMPQYDGSNRWPDNPNASGSLYPYPPMPFINGKMANDAVKFDQVRVNARCSPTRASMFTGRLGHITPEHPHGTGIGDTQNNDNTPHSQTPFWEGLKKETNPWPWVARDAGSPYALANFGKYHLFEYAAPAAVQNRRAPCDEAGFHESHELPLSGAGNPLNGYYNFQYYQTKSDGTDNHDMVAPGDGQTVTDASGWGDATASTIDGTGDPVAAFGPSFLFNLMTTWITEQIQAGKPWFLNWWMNMPHGTMPAFPKVCGPDFAGTPETLHNVYSQAEQGYDHGVWEAASDNGLVRVTGPSMTLYDENGLNPTTVTTGNTGYTSEGRIHTLWHRATAMFESMDTLIGMLSDWLEANHQDEFAKTVFMLYSDNGANQTEMEPKKTNEFGAASTSPSRTALWPDGITSNDLGANFEFTIPPTSDGTETGTPYYDPDNSKGSVHEDGIHSPLIVWGAIPANLKGTTNRNALIDATDFYATFLDIVARDTWRDSLGETELAKVDGVSFWDIIWGDASDRVKDHSFHTVFKPGWLSADTELPNETNLFQYERAIVNKSNWKFVVTYEQTHPDDLPPKAVLDSAFPELYNLNVDPGQDTDLAGTIGQQGGEEALAQYIDLNDQYLLIYGIPPGPPI